MPRRLVRSSPYGGRWIARARGDRSHVHSKIFHSCLSFLVATKIRSK
ncbi:hypothetical protein VPHD530_0008 [Vibrio phage D530]